MIKKYILHNKVKGICYIYEQETKRKYLGKCKDPTHSHSKKEIFQEITQKNIQTLCTICGIKEQMKGKDICVNCSALFNSIDKEDNR